MPPCSASAPARSSDRGRPLFARRVARMSLLADYAPDGDTLRAFLADEAVFARALIGPREGGRKIAAVASLFGRGMRLPAARWRISVVQARAADLVGGTMKAAAEAFGPRFNHCW